MKKIMIMFAAMTFLVACNKELLDVEKQVPSETNGIKVNLSVTRHDSFGSTKATVKSAWADEDVIFVFFKGVAAPKYLEMKYDSGSDTWTPAAKNGLSSSDISDAADKKMTAIYLPYGSTATVVASEGNFIFSDITYSGYFLKTELVTYTYDGDVLSGTLNMTAPALSSGSDKLIHFDISGFTSGHDYKLYQDYVKPLTFTSVSAAGVISKNEGTMGAAITGYEDGSMMSFSGILDASAVGNAVDYQFSIDDVTSSILYTRDAGTKTLSTSKYIGIGAINNTQVWNAIEYVDLGLSVRWAKCNIGASTPEGYGYYYAWGETEPKDQYNWSTYKWCNGSYNTLSKYNSYSRYGTVDNKSTLDIEDDVAHVKFGGSWRIPMTTELDELLSNCTWTWCDSGNSEFGGIAGYKVTSNIDGYTDRFIFLPAAGSHSGVNVGRIGFYWSNSLEWNGDQYFALGLVSYSSNLDLIDSNYIKLAEEFRDIGCSVRPVFLSYNDLSVYFDNNRTNVGVGKAKSLRTMLNVQNDGHDIKHFPIQWISSNTSVATVDDNGFVRGISEGVATITAICKGRSATCRVSVLYIENGHIYVDLGLSVKWATLNIGAGDPSDCGDYYAWGETETKSDYSWSTYKWCNGSYNTLTKYNSNGSYGTVDNKTSLDPVDDVAHVKWGGNWRMPTNAEIDELRTNCTWSIYGYGYRVISNIEGYTDRSIFLPFTGYRENGYLYQQDQDDYDYGHYWSSSLDNSYPRLAYYLYYTYYGRTISTSEGNRYIGRCVRPVCP